MLSLSKRTQNITSHNIGANSTCDYLEPLNKLSKQRLKNIWASSSDYLSEHPNIFLFRIFDQNSTYHYASNWATDQTQHIHVECMSATKLYCFETLDSTSQITTTIYLYWWEHKANILYNILFGNHIICLIWFHFISSY